MAKSYSMDLRSRLVAAVADGSSRREAARRFGVSPSCAVKLLARVEATGSAERAAVVGRLAGQSAALARAEPADNVVARLWDGSAAMLG